MASLYIPFAVALVATQSTGHQNTKEPKITDKKRKYFQWLLNAQNCACQMLNCLQRCTSTVGDQRLSTTDNQS